MRLTRENIYRNRLAYYLIKLDLLGLILLSIFEKWLIVGMSFSQILLLQGIFGVFIVLAEFPSGVLADIRSRKEVLFLGQFLIILGILTYFLAFSFFEFVFAELFFALGLASKSGTDTAFAYDSYLEIQEPQKADDFIARGSQITLFGNVIMLSIGGILTSLDYNLPFILAIFGYSIGLMGLVQAIEPTRIKIQKSSVAIKKAVKYLSHKTVLKVLLMLIFLQVLLRVAFWGYIPKLSIVNIDTQYHGIILGGANLVAFLTSIWTKTNRNREIILLLIPIGVFGLFLMIFDSLLSILLAILFHQLARGVIQVVGGIYLNQVVSSDVRASIGSLLGMIVSLLYFLFSLIVDVLGFNQDLIIMINFIFGLLFFFTWFLIQNNSKKKTTKGPVIYGIQD